MSQREKEIDVKTLAAEQEPVALAMLMGLERPRRFNRLLLSDQIAHGLPFTIAVSTCKRIDPQGARFTILDIVKSATYHRRKKDKKPLSKDASETIYGVLRVYYEALRHYRDREAAQAFMFRPHALLDGLAPIEVAKQSSAGVDAAIDILEGAEAGVAI